MCDERLSNHGIKETRGLSVMKCFQITELRRHEDKCNKRLSNHGIKETQGLSVIKGFQITELRRHEEEV
jgi:uncharacterized protein YcgI (DUF1989 family)